MKTFSELQFVWFRKTYGGDRSDSVVLFLLTLVHNFLQHFGTSLPPLSSQQRAKVAKFLFSVLCGSAIQLKTRLEFVQC